MRSYAEQVQIQKCETHAYHTQLYTCQATPVMYTYTDLHIIETYAAKHLYHLAYMGVHLAKQLEVLHHVQFVCWLVGSLTSQQHTTVSPRQICSDNFTCCHNEIEVLRIKLSTSLSHSILTPHWANQSQC